MTQLLVSCVMPTFNRRRFVPDAIENFLLQTYADRELLVVDDGSDPVGDLMPVDPRIRYVRLDEHIGVGAKRNVACRLAKGEVIVHWDDDDWSAPTRVEEQVRVLFASGADLCGQRELLFYEPATDRGWRYRYPEQSRPWVAGGTMCYRRDLWTRHPFPDVRKGEDTQFVWSGDLKIATLTRDDLYLATIHRGNTSAKRTSGRRWVPVPLEEIRSMLGTAAERYLSSTTAVVPARLGGERDDMTETTTNPRGTPSMTEAKTDPGAHVTVSIPHRGSGAPLRRAVESILNQTHQNLTCVVVFDGDETGLEELSDIDDERLVRHVLSESRGRYFADQVVLDVTTDPYFLVQDSDDWSDHTRVERLMAELQRTGADVCLSDILRHETRTDNKPASRQGWPRLGEPLGPRFVHRAGHQGLYRTELLRAIGGWYAGHRIGYDTAILNFVLMAGGRVATVPAPLYHRTMREGSLTTSPETGHNTPERQRVTGQLAELHRRAYRATSGLDGDDAAAALRRLTVGARGADASAALRSEAQALAPLMPHDRSQGAHGSFPAVPAVRGPSVTADVERRRPGVHELLDRYGGDNPGWSISPLGAVELDARVSRTKPARILDVGSGLSTVVAAAAAARYGGHVLSLEHDEHYAARTRAMLADSGLSQVANVAVVPLVETEHACGRGPWYAGQPSGTFDFFVVHGPPFGAGGRVAAFPALARHRRRNWEMWLLNADRQHEQECIEAWSRHFRFDVSGEKIDEGGVAVLRGKGRVVGDPGVVDGLGISLLTGGRPDLLAATLQSFENRWPEQARAAHVCVFVNGEDQTSRTLAEETHWIDRTLTYGSDMLSIGVATSIVAGSVAGHGDVDLVLHLEDDWETRTLDSSALARAATLLDDQSVGQVRLRHRSEKCLTEHMITGETINWRQSDGHRRAQAHFTFNPSLVRASVVDRVFPAVDQHEAQLRFLATGLDVLELEPGAFVHIGGGVRSRRLGAAKRGRAGVRRM